MKITLKFADGCRGVYSEMGKMLGFYDGRKKILGEDDGCPWNVGIWDDDKKKTELWGDVVKKIAEGTYKLPKNALLDNGQVTDEEGVITKIYIK